LALAGGGVYGSGATTTISVTGRQVAVGGAALGTGSGIMFSQHGKNRITNEYSQWSIEKLNEELKNPNISKAEKQKIKTAQKDKQQRRSRQSKDTRKQ
jgi:hypothetical protein